MPARIAIVGAATDRGLRLRDALVRAGVAGERVDLYGTTRGEWVLGEYDGEARVIQEVDWTEILDHEVVYVCESGCDPEGRARAAGGQRLVIDLSLSTVPGQAGRLLDPADDMTGASRGYLAVPHEISTLLAEVLRPLETRWGIDQAQAVVLRPAADFGQSGVDELRDQTVRLLNFAEAPREVFGRQLAFNLVPSVPAAGEGELEQRVVDEVSGLLGWSQRRVAVALLVAPLFFGHGVQLRVVLTGGTDAGGLRETFVDAGLTRADDAAGGAGTPLDVAADRATCVAEVREDGLGGFWIWVVAGENHVRGVDLAVEAAGTLLAG